MLTMHSDVITTIYGSEVYQVYRMQSKTPVVHKLGVAAAGINFNKYIK